MIDTRKTRKHKDKDDGLNLESKYTAFRTTAKNRDLVGMRDSRLV